MKMNKALLFILFYALSLITFAQDTIYMRDGNSITAFIRDNQYSFIEYRNDLITKQNLFMDKKLIHTIRFMSGLLEEVQERDTGYYSTISFIESNGDTSRLDYSYNPTASLSLDTLIKLRRFSNNKFYTRNYIDHPHFYINDTDKRFLSSSEITYLGVNFEFIKLVSETELGRSIPLKLKYLKQLCIDINGNEDLKNYQNSFIKDKKTWIDTREAVLSYNKVQTLSWVSKKEYAIEAGKIPAIIESLSYEQKKGLGLIFIVERFSKSQHAVSGYWVVFDFADRKPLLIDYTEFNKIQYQFDESSVWCSYWQYGLVNGGVYNPLSFNRYLELQKKGQLQLTD